MCYKNPAKRVQFSSSAHKRVKRVLTEKQIAIVREEALEAFPAAALLLDTGMRRGELLALLWSDLAPQNRSISVTKSDSRLNGELVVSQPKTQHSIRTLLIPQ